MKSKTISLILWAVICCPVIAQSYPDTEWKTAGRSGIPNANEVFADVGQVFQLERLPQNTSTASAGIPDAVRQSYYSVAKVTKTEPGGQQSGSATYLGSGLWLSNAHVVLSSQKGQFSVTTKQGLELPAKVIHVEMDQEPDLALIETQSVDHLLKAVPLLDESDAPSIGSVVYPSGFDRGNMSWHTIWPARIVNRYMSGSLESVGYGQRKGAISGNSGGPTFSPAGELIAPLNANGGGNTYDGSGSTITVCWRQTRTFLLPWRERIWQAIQTQCGPGNVCPPGYGMQQPQYPQQGGQGVPRPTLPQQPQAQQPQQIPSFKPPQQTLPLQPSNNCQVDYDKLADSLLPKMAADERFRGPAGPAGKDGKDGAKSEDGKDGEDGSVSQAHIRQITSDVINALAGDTRLKGSDGNEGKSGKDGRGVKRLFVEDGKLKTEFTDGTIDVIAGIPLAKKRDDSPFPDGGTVTPPKDTGIAFYSIVPRK